MIPLKGRKVTVINPKSLYFGMTGEILASDTDKISVKIDYPKGAIPMWQLQLFDKEELCFID
jgi:hypothetical protein